MFSGISGAIITTYYRWFNHLGLDGDCFQGNLSTEIKS
jgi:hypothetical protein